MIQEHRLGEGPMASMQLNAIAKGWQGVWEPALNTGKHGRSGGVATLVRQPVHMTRGTGGYGHTWHRVMIQWMRKTKIHLVNIYGKDGLTTEDDEVNHKIQGLIQQELQCLGRVPWVWGWNQEPAQLEQT